MPRQLVDIPDHKSISEKCFTDLKSAFDNGKGIETDRADASFLIKHARNHITWKKLPFKASIKTGNDGVSVVWLERRPARNLSIQRQPGKSGETFGHECFTKLEDAFAKGKGIEADRQKAYGLLTHARNYIASNKLPFKARIKTGRDGTTVVRLERRSTQPMGAASPENPTPSC